MSFYLATNPSTDRAATGQTLEQAKYVLNATIRDFYPCTHFDPVETVAHPFTFDFDPHLITLTRIHK